MAWIADMIPWWSFWLIRLLSYESWSASSSLWRSRNCFGKGGCWELGGIEGGSQASINYYRWKYQQYLQFSKHSSHKGKRLYHRQGKWGIFLGLDFWGVDLG
jgi:hypothetical protein